MSYNRVDSSEKPDFIVMFDEGENAVKIGCEITEYYADKGSKKGSAQKGFDAAWKRFSDALNKALPDDIKNKKGTIHFGNLDINQFDSSFQNLLIKEICQIGSAEQYSSEIDVPYSIKYPTLSKYVHKIFFHESIGDSPHWFYGHKQSGYLCDPRDEIIKIAKEKNDKSINYQWDNCDEIWLIIFSDTELLNNLVGIYENPDLQKHLSGIRFKRIYLWNKFFEEIDELFPTYNRIFSPKMDTLYRCNYPESVRRFVVDGSPK